MEKNDWKIRAERKWEFFEENQNFFDFSVFFRNFSAPLIDTRQVFKKIVCLKEKMDWKNIHVARFVGTETMIRVTQTQCVNQALILEFFDGKFGYPFVLHPALAWQETWEFRRVSMKAPLSRFYLNNCCFFCYFCWFS